MCVSKISIYTNIIYIFIICISDAMKISDVNIRFNENNIQHFVCTFLLIFSVKETNFSIKKDTISLEHAIFPVTVYQMAKFWITLNIKHLPLANWLVVLRFNATLTAKVISWQSVMHMHFLAFLHQY